MTSTGSSMKTTVATDYKTTRQLNLMASMNRW